MTDNLDVPTEAGERLCARCSGVIAPLPPVETETGLREALREALDWQPIATAPKDGTRIILCWDDCPNLSAHVELGKFKPSEGVWCNTYGKAFSGESTHWMPLPPPPAARAALAPHAGGV